MTAFVPSEFDQAADARQADRQRLVLISDALKYAHAEPPADAILF